MRRGKPYYELAVRGAGRLLAACAASSIATAHLCIGNLCERMAGVEGLLEGYVAQGRLPQAQ